MRQPTFLRVLLAGTLSGLASGITANLLAAAIATLIQQQFLGLNPWAIGIASVLANLGGGLLFYGLTRWSSHPTRLFAVLALLLAALFSALVWMQMPAHFAAIAAPVHFLVAGVAIWVIPQLSLALRPK